MADIATPRSRGTVQVLRALRCVKINPNKWLLADPQIIKRNTQIPAIIVYGGSPTVYPAVNSDTKVRYALKIQDAMTRNHNPLGLGDDTPPLSRSSEASISDEDPRAPLKSLLAKRYNEN